MYVQKALFFMVERGAALPLGSFPAWPCDGSGMAWDGSVFVLKECPMTLIEVVILAGAQCLSPVQEARGTTEAGKVPCAVLIRMDQQTGDVEFTPPAAATDPQVIAMLIQPDPAGADPQGEGDAQVAEAALVSVKTNREAAPVREKAKPLAKASSPRKAVRDGSVVKKQRRARRGDACGSYKAVWYTNKQGRRKYRCARQG
jgi:hypothetical protein